MNTVTVSPKYQVVIPLEVRNRAKIHSGQRMQVIYYNDRIELLPIRDAKIMKGFLTGLNTNLERDNDRI